MVESSKRMQKDAARKLQKQNEPEKKVVAPVSGKAARPPVEGWQDTVTYFVQDASEAIINLWNEDPKSFLLHICLLMLFILWWKVSNLHNLIIREREEHARMTRAILQELLSA